MRWKVVCERPLYQDEWLDIRVAGIELPDGRRLAHRCIRTPPGAGVAAVDSAWVPLAGIRTLITGGQITSGTTVAALLYLLSEPDRPGNPARGGG